MSEGGLNPCRPNLADRKCWSARLPPVRASCGRLPISNAKLGSSTYFPLYPKKWKALKHPQRPKVLCSATNQANVRFGSKADMCGALGHVRFTPNTDRESGFLQKVMSALPPKADMCSATRDVRYGPEADIETTTGAQESNAAARGKVTLISVNSPGRVSTSIEPPCCFTTMS